MADLVGLTGAAPCGGSRTIREDKLDAVATHAVTGRRSHRGRHSERPPRLNALPAVRTPLRVPDIAVDERDRERPDEDAGRAHRASPCRRRVLVSHQRSEELDITADGLLAELVLEEMVAPRVGIEPVGSASQVELLGQSL